MGARELFGNDLDDERLLAWDEGRRKTDRDARSTRPFPSLLAVFPLLQQIPSNEAKANTCILYI